MLYELRVLDGQHQGAALPLFGEQWWIGATDEADLALYDPGIAVRHAQLRCVADCWSVQAQEGLLHDGAGQTQARITDLGIDTPFAVGNVRLYVALADQPWPQEPAPAAPALIRTPPPGAPALQQKRLVGLLGLGALLTLALGLALTDDPQASLMGATEHKPALDSAYEVRQQLLKMLGERELGDRLALEVVNGQVVISGVANADEVGLVSRMLNRFREQFDTPVPVISRVREQSRQLPFRIVQIVGGTNGHVVLDEGRRVFLGDEVDGVRLISIEPNKVVFDGQQRYEVGW